MLNLIAIKYKYKIGYFFSNWVDCDLVALGAFTSMTPDDDFCKYILSSLFFMRVYSRKRYFRLKEESERRCS